MESSNDNATGFNFKNIVDVVIRLGVLLLLLFWCFDILKPFILILIWAVVIAIAIFPVYETIVKIFRGRTIFAAIVLTLFLVSVIIIPSGLIVYSLYEGVNHFRELFSLGQPLIPAPGGSTANWPSIAKPIIEIWQLASENLHEAIMRYSDEIKEYGSLLLLSFAGVGKGIASFIVSIIISGFLLIYSDTSIIISKKIFQKLIGSKGDHFAETTVLTIRNVVKGVLGVAVIQASMAGIGFFVAGVPYAGLWAMACLIFAIVQVGVGPIAIPICIYMFSVSSTGTAVMLSIWIGITLITDNILKPILLGRNAPAPMMVIFLGSIGGFIYNGFIGLFLGAIVLTIGYKLFMMWLDGEIED
ncbi:AI-2E family transporter [Flavobacterium cellulosilyticum]|uniref:AI-2E family transporter n=1 Tax=Flavobacterium cellulosilyticum TaxID=2541731 RepID=A0A4R5C828_9FLAO|nr:AI-2E family transporter [Flavobacterium cellulosilyticum]TDD95981.1 AI-2E family transporter [Flavobacterium cellulosilyticum]